MKRIPLLLAALLLTGAAHAAPNLLVNGSFEQGTAGIGSFAGWQTVFGDPSTFVDSSGQTGTHPGQASSGLWSAYFGSTRDSGGSSISQTIATTQGRTFVLSFDLANDNGGFAAADGFVASLDGLGVFRAVDLPVQDYVRESFTFVATSASTLLSFSAYNDFGYLQLDNVSISAIPEPQPLALLVVGLLAIGTTQRIGRRSPNTKRDRA